MTDIPPGWMQATLGDLLLRIETGKSFRCEARPARAEEWGIIKVSAMTWGEFREKENKAVRPDTAVDPANEVKPGDILLSRANTESYVGASVLVGECRPRLLLSDKSLRLIPSPSIDRCWLALLLSSPGIRREISRRATGTKDSMRNISQGSLRDVRVMVPPFAEQCRIVAALDDHLSRLGAAGISVQAAQRRRQILAERLVDARLEVLDATSRPLFSVLSEPLINGRSVPTDSSGFPVLRLTALRDGRLALSERKGGRWTATDAAPFVVRKGDFFISRGNGSLSLVGRGALLEEEPDPVAFPDTMVRIRIDQKQISPEFFRITWGSRGVRTQIERSARTTAGIHKINQRIIEAIRIPVPALSEQHRIIAEIQEAMEGVHRLSSQIQHAAAYGERLRRSLLTEAFAGRLVEQNSADESASESFERVRAGQATQTAARSSSAIGKRTKGAKAPQKETLL